MIEDTLRNSLQTGDAPPMPNSLRLWKSYRAEKYQRKATFRLIASLCLFSSAVVCAGVGLLLAMGANPLAVAFFPAMVLLWFAASYLQVRARHWQQRADEENQFATVEKMREPMFNAKAEASPEN